MKPCLERPCSTGRGEAAEARRLRWGAPQESAAHSALEEVRLERFKPLGPRPRSAASCSDYIPLAELWLIKNRAVASSRAHLDSQ